MDPKDAWIFQVVNGVTTSAEAKIRIKHIESRLNEIIKSHSSSTIYYRNFDEKLKDAFNKRIVELTKKENTIVKYD